MPDTAVVKARIDAIEAEMKRIGYWREEPLPSEMFEFRTAFAMDTMPFSYWLQFILIPTVNEIITSGSQFPRASQVGVQAVREFDGVTETSELVRMLIEFDHLIEQS